MENKTNNHGEKYAFQKKLTRREFIKASAAAGAALSFPVLLSGCGGSHGKAFQGGLEMRDLFFDLSHLSQKKAYFLVKGGTRFYLEPVKTADALATARKSNPMLEMIPDKRITHATYNVPFPTDNLALCYVLGKDPASPRSCPDMAHLFFHIPSEAMNSIAKAGALPAPGACKLRFYGADASGYSDDLKAYTNAHCFKTPVDQATSLVFSHQEMMSADPTAAAYLQQNIIEQDGNTYVLAESLYSQGDNWATSQVLTDPATGDILYNSQGEPQMVPLWSDQTSQYAGPAIVSTLTKAKNDTTLGTNMTGRTPDGDNSDMQGKIWAIHDGQSSVVSDALPGDTAFNMKTKFVSASPGFSVSVSNPTEDRTITLTVKNWYLRYLGLYIRYLGTDGKPLLRASLPQNVQDSFPAWAADLNTDYDSFAMIINPEFALLSIPVKSDTQTFTVLVPEEAATVVVLASGLGDDNNSFSDMIPKPGKAMTAIINLALPALFLAMTAGTLYAGFTQKLNLTDYKSICSIVTSAIMGGVGALVYHDSKSMYTALVQIGQYLLSQGLPLSKKIAAYLGKATTSDVTDGIPVIGVIIMAASSAAMLAGIGETIGESCRSPEVYDYQITFVHDIGVTISHDPNDPNFPDTAATYEVNAVFDNGSTFTSGPINMPGQPWSDDITYTFSSMPMGGLVKFTTVFRAADGWAAGQGTTNMLTNDSNLANQAISITENKVPLDASTYYSHRAVSSLDANGNIQWTDTATPPAQTEAALACENVDGDLCELVGITVSEKSGATGYAWKAYSSQLQYCQSQTTGQMYSFASLPITQNPQNGHKIYPCGFLTMPRVVYDLAAEAGLGATSNNYYVEFSTGEHLARQIRLNLDAQPDWDTADSNKCFGRFYLQPDALLLHPAGKLLSINSEYDKLEVLDLPSASVADADAPLSHVYSATGTRTGLMKGPVSSGVMPSGEVVILEQINKRIQAFDIFGNPAPIFSNNQYYVPLHAETLPVTYLDLAVEAAGYIYVLSFATNNGQYQYRLDIYSPEGDFVSRTTGVNASKVTIDYWRNAYTLNYQPLTLPSGQNPGITEPSVSIWIPSTP